MDTLSKQEMALSFLFKFNNTARTAVNLSRYVLPAILLTGLVNLGGWGASVFGADVSLVLDAGTTRVGKRCKSLLELRQERVILQNLDYSC